MTSKQRFVEDEGGCLEQIWGKRIPGRRDSKCKGPEEGMGLVCPRPSKKTSVVQVDGARGVENNRRGWRGKRRAWVRSRRALGATVKTLSFL